MHFYPGIRPGELTLRTYLARLMDIPRVARFLHPPSAGAGGGGDTIDAMLDDMEADGEFDAEDDDDDGDA